MNDDRLIKIETKLAYQEKTLKDLNEVVCEQQKEIEKLTAEDLKKVANNYFSSKNRTVVVLKREDAL